MRSQVHPLPRSPFPFYTHSMIEICDWNKHFENDASRRVIDARWFPCKNNMGRPKFQKIMRHPEACTIFGFFIILCELASLPSCPKREAENRGRIHDSIEDIAGMVNLSIEKAASYLDILESNGWIRMDTDENVSKHMQTARARAQEGKGMEGKGRELIPSPKKKHKPPLTADKAPPDSRIKEILDFYHDECEKIGIKGSNYEIGAVLIKRWLKTQSPEFLKEMITWRLKGGPGLPMLATLDQLFKSYCVNKYISWYTADQRESRAFAEDNR